MVKRNSKLSLKHNVSLTLNLTLILTAPGDAELSSAGYSLSHSHDSAGPCLHALFEWEPLQEALIMLSPWPQLFLTAKLMQHNCIKQSPGRADPRHWLFGKGRSTASSLSSLVARKTPPGCCLCPSHPVFPVLVLEDLHILLR